MEDLQLRDSYRSSLNVSNIYQYQIYVLFKGSVSDPSGGGASAVKQCESKFDPSLDFQAALHACKVHKHFER